MGDVLSVQETAGLSAKAFRRYYLNDLLCHARAKAPVPPDLTGGSAREVGLTQEQVSRLLDMVVRRYREFEHGERVHPDPGLLDEVARVLGMSDAERYLLYLLAADRLPPSPAPSGADIAELQPMLDAYGDIPALITDIAWNLQAWNDAVTETVVDPTEYPEELRNTLLWLFTPEAAERFPQMPGEYEMLVGRVRAAYIAAGGHSPQLQRLAERLMEIPFAAEYWNAGALALEPVNQKRLLHSPVQGTEPVRTISTVSPEGLRLVQFVPTIVHEHG